MSSNPPNYQRLKVIRNDQQLLGNLLKPLTRAANKKGLLGYRDLTRIDGMQICEPVIHMFAMKIPLDLVFLDRGGVVVKVCRNVKPGPRLRGSLKARSVLELSFGTIDRFGIKTGDRLDLVEG